MATHGAVTFVMHEQHTKISSGSDRFSDDTPVHIVMSSRFPHKCTTNVVKMLQHVASMFQNGRTLYFRQATCDNPKWFAFDMSIRSEERRVGKECGSRWWQKHE